MLGEALPKELVDPLTGGLGSGRAARPDGGDLGTGNDAPSPSSNLVQKSDSEIHDTILTFLR